jgi:hypothetical protein
MEAEIISLLGLKGYASNGLRILHESYLAIRGKTYESRVMGVRYKRILRETEIERRLTLEELDLLRCKGDLESFDIILKMLDARQRWETHKETFGEHMQERRP